MITLGVLACGARRCCMAAAPPAHCDAAAVTAAVNVSRRGPGASTLPRRGAGAAARAWVPPAAATQAATVTATIVTPASAMRLTRLTRPVSVLVPAATTPLGAAIPFCLNEFHADT